VFIPLKRRKHESRSLGTGSLKLNLGGPVSVFGQFYIILDGMKDEIVPSFLLNRFNYDYIII